MHLQRDKGLCFHCDERDSLNHKCPNRHMMLLEVDDDEEEPQEEEQEHQQDSELVPVESPQHHLSFNALRGFIVAGTMRFEGRIQGAVVQILLDSGSSDNFIQPRIAKSLKLPIQPSPQFQVMVGNGQTMPTEGVVQDLQVTIQGHELTLSVYLLPITRADIVLGEHG